MYNDRMAQIQEESGNRLLPLPLMSAWNVDYCVAEAERVAAQGARGVNMTSDPHDLGGPDLADLAWDPFWETCAGLQLPVHFHIGASARAWASTASTRGPRTTPTPSWPSGARCCSSVTRASSSTTIASGMFERHPDLKMVSVESGAGWIPFILEALEYEMAENAPKQLAAMTKSPAEYFAGNLYATFWFENNRNKLPEMATLAPDTQKKILGENARKLYRL